MKCIDLQNLKGRPIKEEREKAAHRAQEIMRRQRPVKKDHQDLTFPLRPR
jgi:hypothetical protein